MNRFKLIILITGILVAALAFHASAQKRPEKTSSAKAYYGPKPGKHKYKTVKARKQKFAGKKPVRNKGRVHASVPFRRKSYAG